MVQGTHIHLKKIFPEYISPDLLNHENLAQLAWNELTLQPEKNNFFTLFEAFHSIVKLIIKYH